MCDVSHFLCPFPLQVLWDLMWEDSSLQMALKTWAQASPYWAPGRDLTCSVELSKELILLSRHHDWCLGLFL